VLVVEVVVHGEQQSPGARRPKRRLTSRP
jgi:hypothetical protein